MKLNDKIIKLRKEKGLSQEDLGNKLEVSRQTVSKWELGETQPSIDKIKELSKIFEISYDYLLDDTIEEKKNNINLKYKKKHKILKIISILVLIYLIISLIKFIILYNYYNISNNFSEDKYTMIQNYELNDKNLSEHIITKIGNEMLIENYAFSNTITDNSIEDHQPINISYTNKDTNTAYYLTYDGNENYYYNDRKEEAINEEELQEIMNIENEGIKKFTLDLIPSNFKDILLKSINPMIYIDVFNNTIYINHMNQMKERIVLTKDCLVESYSRSSEFDSTMKLTLSYDYVPEHFKDRYITEPLETYKDKVIKY